MTSSTTTRVERKLLLVKPASRVERNAMRNMIPVYTNMVVTGTSITMDLATA